MQEGTEIAVARTGRKKFLTALLAGLLALGGIIAMFGLSATAFALPMGGMGDFYVELDELQGKGFKLSPHIGETGNADEAPMVRNEIDEATIKGLHIYKDVKLPGGGWIRININASGETKIKGLIQDAKLINANLKFNEGLEIVEKNTDDFSENWTQKADQITIKDAKIVTDYLFQSFVSLQGAKISVEKIDEPEMSGD